MYKATPKPEFIVQNIQGASIFQDLINDIEAESSFGNNKADERSNGEIFEVINENTECLGNSANNNINFNNKRGNIETDVSLTDGAPSPEGSESQYSSYIKRGVPLWRHDPTIETDVSSTDVPLSSEGSENQFIYEKKKKKKDDWFHRVWKSGPDEYFKTKSAFAFPFGCIMAVIIFYLVIDNLPFPQSLRGILGGALSFLLVLAYTFSLQMRCVSWIVLPTFVGRAGRSYIAAFAIMYLIDGPLHNIIKNTEETARVITCTRELLKNHSEARSQLRMAPISNAMGDLTRDGFLVEKATHDVKTAFQPLRDDLEAEGLDDERKRKRRSIFYDDAEDEEERQRRKEEGKQIEKKWEKKMNERCEEVWNAAVQKCKDKMASLYDDCYDKLGWFVGTLACWPMKIDQICNLVKHIPRNTMGMECNSKEMIPEGFGEQYLSARNTIDELDQAMKVNLQYSVKGGPNLGILNSVMEARAGTMVALKGKTKIVKDGLDLVSTLLSFTFLLLFKSAYKYNKKYLSDLSYDNVHLTPYFRHIDARRVESNKRGLLPLKKLERQRVVVLGSLALTKDEKIKFGKGSLNFIIRITVSAIICYMDHIFFKVLSLIREHSQMHIHSTGEHSLKHTVEGVGFMAAMVRSFLQKFTQTHVLDYETNNDHCLPVPSEVEGFTIAFIFATQILVWVFIYIEAYGLRLRHTIAAFFYRKREKKRILSMYNEMFRKRHGYLRMMRHTVRKQLRKRELKKELSVLASLRRQFPRCCGWLKMFGGVKETCLVCGEPENKDFHKCLTPGCGVAYCPECWGDCKKRCYACGENSQAASEASSLSTLTEDEFEPIV